MRILYINNNIYYYVYNIYIYIVKVGIQRTYLYNNIFIVYTDGFGYRTYAFIVGGVCNGGGGGSGKKNRPVIFKKQMTDDNSIRCLKRWRVRKNRSFKRFTYYYLCYNTTVIWVEEKTRYVFGTFFFTIMACVFVFNIITTSIMRDWLRQDRCTRV